MAKKNQNHLGISPAVYLPSLSPDSRLSSALEWKRKSMLLLLLLPELNIASAISATAYSTSLPLRVVDGPAPPPPPPITMPLLLLPALALWLKCSIESHVLRGTELDCGGWVVIIWAISRVISVAVRGNGGIDGAVDDMWHV